MKQSLLPFRNTTQGTSEGLAALCKNWTCDKFDNVPAPAVSGIAGNMEKGSSVANRRMMTAIIARLCPLLGKFEIENSQEPEIEAKIKDQRMDRSAFASDFTSSLNTPGTLISTRKDFEERLTCDFT